MNNTLTVETPIIFKHTINLNDYPEFNQLSEEVIKKLLTGMVVKAFEVKEMYLLSGSLRFSLANSLTFKN